MRKVAIIAISALLLSACGNSEIKSAREFVKSNLKDPDSAQFKDEKSPSDRIVCGMVNSKNEFGGYSGFIEYAAIHLKDGWSLRLGRDDKYGLVRKVCNTPIDDLIRTLRYNDTKDEWFAKVYSNSGASELNSLGLKAYMSKTGSIYVGPFENVENAELAAISISVRTGMASSVSQWKF